MQLMIPAGFSGSAPIAIGGGSVSDLFSERDRASAMALYCLGPLLGDSFDSATAHSSLSDNPRSRNWPSGRWIHHSNYRHQMGVHRHRK